MGLPNPGGWRLARTVGYCGLHSGCIGGAFCVREVPLLLEGSLGDVIGSSVDVTATINEPDLHGTPGDGGDADAFLPPGGLFMFLFIVSPFRMGCADGDFLGDRDNYEIATVTILGGFVACAHGNCSITASMACSRIIGSRIVRIVGGIKVVHPRVRYFNKGAYHTEYTIEGTGADFSIDFGSPFT